MFVAAGLGLAALSSGFAAAQDKSPLPDPVLDKKYQEGKKFEDGKWMLPDGTPTYNVIRDEANTDIV